MQLNDAQREQVTTWIANGAKLSEIQNRLAAEFGIRLTYMEARFLVDDLKLVPKDPEPVKPVEVPAATPPPAAPAPAAEALPGEELPPAATKVSVTVDQITRPGSLVSGKVNFSDGQEATWYLDQMGRLGLAPKQQGYKPTAADVQEFQLALQREIARLGY